MDWNALAVEFTEEHFRDDFKLHWYVDSRYEYKVICVGNNAPPRGRLSARDKQFQIISKEAAKIGLVQLGYGEFPERGVEEGYSCLAIYGYPDDRLDNLPWQESERLLDDLLSLMDAICAQAFATPFDDD